MDLYAKKTNYCMGDFKGYDYLILGGNYPCAYVKIPKGSKLYKMEYEEADKLINVHGGVTYSEDHYPTQFKFDSTEWWIGWDYAHTGDAMYVNDVFITGKLWGFDDIEKECFNVIDQIIKVGKTQKIVAKKFNLAEAQELDCWENGYDDAIHESLKVLKDTFSLGCPEPTNLFWEKDFGIKDEMKVLRHYFRSMKLKTNSDYANGYNKGIDIILNILANLLNENYPFIVLDKVIGPYRFGEILYNFLSEWEK